MTSLILPQSLLLYLVLVFFGLQ